MDIANILNKEPGNYISDIIDDIEKKIINGVINTYPQIACL